jgi:hypothetical protein
MLCRTTPSSGGEPAAYVSHNSEAFGGWLPPLMVVIRTQVRYESGNLHERAIAERMSAATAGARASRWLADTMGRRNDFSQGLGELLSAFCVGAGKCPWLSCSPVLRATRGTRRQDVDCRSVPHAPHRPCILRFLVRRARNNGCSDALPASFVVGVWAISFSGLGAWASRHGADWSRLSPFRQVACEGTGGRHLELPGSGAKSDTICPGESEPAGWSEREAAV